MTARLPMVEPVPLAQRITTRLTRIHVARRSRSWKSTGTRGTAPAQSQLLLRSRPRRTTNSSDFLVHAAETLPVQDQETLLGTPLKVLRTLQERGEIPDVRMCLTCRHFRSNIHVDPDQPHHCAALDAPCGNRQLRGECPAHRPVASEPPPTSRPARTRRDKLTLPSRSGLL